MRKLPFIGLAPVADISISLREGLRLTTGGRRLILVNFNSGEILLQDLDTSECRETNEVELLQAIFDQKVQIVDESLASAVFGDEVVLRLQAKGVTQKALDQGAAKHAWLSALRQEGVTRFADELWLRSKIDELARGELSKLPRFEINTLYEAARALREADGDPTILVPRYGDRGGRGKWRIHPGLLKIITDEISNDAPVKKKGDKFQPKPSTPRVLTTNINSRVGDYNLAHPDDPLPPACLSTVTRIRKKLVPEYELAVKNLGKEAAHKLFRSNSGRRDKAERPLECSEYDDIDAGVFLVESRGLPWGRAFVTNGLDQNSDLTLASVLGDEHRSFESAVDAVCDSLVPKAYGSVGEVGYGPQGQMIVDNATYNTGTAMEERSEVSNLLLSFAKPREPTEKSGIEHFNCRVKSEFCSTLPGWVGNDRDGVDHGASTAILTVEEFRGLYLQWVCGVYANTPGEDGFTPKQRWLRFFSKWSPRIRYTPQQIALMRLRPEKHSFRESGGLLRKGLAYDCQALVEMRRHWGHSAEVMTFVNRRDLSYLMVFDPLANTLIRVPSTEDEVYMTGLTDRLHDNAIRIAYEGKNYNPSVKDLRNALEKLKVMVQQAAASNKLRLRAWAQRNSVPATAGANSVTTAAAPTLTDQLRPRNLPEPGRSATSPKSKPAQSPPRERLMTDLEYLMVQLGQIQLPDRAGT